MMAECPQIMLDRSLATWDDFLDACEQHIQHTLFRAGSIYMQHLM